MLRYEKFCLKAAKLAAYGVLIVPVFFTAKLFFPYTSTKTFLFRTLVEIAFVFWVPLIIFFKECRPKVNAFILLPAALLLSAAISSVFGLSFRSSFWSDLERMMGFLTYAHLFVFYLILISVFRDEREWKKLFTLSLAVSLIISVFGIWQKFMNDLGRIESTYGNAAFLASYLLINLFLAFYLLAKEKGFGGKAWFFLSVLLIDGFVLFLTGTRGAILGAALGFFVILISGIFYSDRIRLFFYKSKTIRIFSILALTAIILTVGVIFVFRSRLQTRDFPEVISRLASISTNDRTVQGRLLVWQVALRGIRERPLLGWGPENFILLSNFHYDPRLFAQEPWIDRAHNLFLDISAAQGLVGFLIMLALFVVFLRGIWRPRNERFSFSDKAILTGFSAAYLVNSLFVFDNTGTLMVLVFIAAYVAYNSFDPIRVKFANTALFFTTFGIFLAVGIFIFSQSVWAPFYANFSARKVYASLLKDPARANAFLFEEYKNTIEKSPYKDVETRRAFADFLVDVKRKGYNFNVPDELSMSEIAMELMAENLKMDPLNIRWVVYQSNLMNLAARYDLKYSSEAEELIKEKMYLSPRRQQIYFDLAQAQFDQGKIDEAIATIDQAITLFDRYPAAHRHKAVFLIMAGRDSEAEVEIEWLKKNSWPRVGHRGEVGWHTVYDDWEIISNAYLRVKNYKKAAEFFEMRISALEADFARGEGAKENIMADKWANMAGLYAFSGDRDKAYEAALKAISYDLSPQRKKEAENFLKTIGKTLPSGN